MKVDELDAGVAVAEGPQGELALVTGRHIRGAQLRRSMVLITQAWIFGSVWVNAVAGTPLTNYAKSLNASELQFGLLAALPFLATLVALPASLLVERTGQRQRIFLIGAYLNRFLWLPIALVPWWIVHHYGVQGGSVAAMSVLLGLLLLMHASGWVGSTAWTSWMADVIPERIRGRYFSRRRQWALLSAIPAAYVAGWMLDRYAGSGTDGLRMLQWCAIVFIVAAAFGLIDIAHFHYIPSVPKRPQRGSSAFKAWREPLRNRQFLWFVGFVGTITFAVVFMGQFVTLYILAQLSSEGGKGLGGAHLNTVTQMMLIVAPCLAQLAVFGIWGHAADRMGKRPLLVIAGLGLVPIAVAWCFVTPSTIWLGYVLSCAGAMLWPGIELATTNLVFELSNSADKEKGGGGSGYFAICSVISNVAGGLGGIAAGVIAQVLQNHHWQWVTSYKTFTFYEVLFVLSAVMRLAAVVIFVPKLHEPEARPTREALRFMSANIYNNLFNAVLLPLRLLGAGREESYPESEEGKPPQFGKQSPSEKQAA
jgi:MFS family permease